MVRLASSVVIISSPSALPKYFLIVAFKPLSGNVIALVSVNVLFGDGEGVGRDGSACRWQPANVTRGNDTSIIIATAKITFLTINTTHIKNLITLNLNKKAHNTSSLAADVITMVTDKYIDFILCYHTCFAMSTYGTCQVH